MNSPSNWQEPKVDWRSGDPVGAADFNRIEKNIGAIETGERALDQAQVPNSNIGTLRQILNWLLNRIKAILGTSNWYDAPPITLKAVSNHIGAGGEAHALATAESAGFMSAGDKMIFDQRITKSNIANDGDYVALEGFAQAPHVIVVPRNLRAYNGLRGDTSQRIESYAENITRDGFTVICRAWEDGDIPPAAQQLDNQITVVGDYRDIVSILNLGTKITIKGSNTHDVHVWADPPSGFYGSVGSDCFYKIEYRETGSEDWIGYGTFKTELRSPAYGSRTLYAKVQDISWQHVITLDGPGEYEVRVTYVRTDKITDSVPGQTTSATSTVNLIEMITEGGNLAASGTATWIATL